MKFEHVLNTNKKKIIPDTRRKTLTRIIQKLGDENRGLAVIRTATLVASAAQFKRTPVDWEQLKKLHDVSHS